MRKADVISYYGSAQKAANAVGLKSRQAIYAWPEVVPEAYQYKFFRVTGGKLSLSPGLELPKAQKAREARA